MQLAQVTRGELRREEVDLSALAQMVAQRVCRDEGGRELRVSIQPELRARADARLLQVLLENLLANACKFTSQEPLAEISVGTLGDEESDAARAPGQIVYYVRDNGVGFDAAGAEGLFQPFKRFHKPEEFPGTGVGLATVMRVATRHGGRVWIESAPSAGTTVYFTL
jgi:signal transduction histidine kinase